MSKKNKKRLVTGLACALPVAIAIPSLLTLTQCGSKESTEHIKLSGKTKKEDTKYVFDKKVKYELSLQNINDPLKTQISLPVLKVNGHDIPESQKYLMYTAEVSANGLVTIEFDVEKIKASVSTTNDQEYEVRFNVNLRSEEFNETLADFKLNIITPTFDVITDESTGVNITCEKQCKYGNDYEVTVKPVEYHEIDIDHLKIKIGADEVQDDTDVVKFTKKEKGEVTFKIVGDYIKDKITLIFKGTKIAYEVNMDGCKEGDETHFTIPGLELAGNVAKYGETVDYYLKWKPDGKTFAKDEAGKPKAYVKDGQGNLIEGAIFDEYQLYIPGDKITGPIFLSCEYATINVKTYIHSDTGVIIHAPLETPVWTDLEITYDILEQDEISSVEILVGKKAIPYDPTGKEGYKLSRDTLTSGKLFIPGKFINDEIDITLEQAQKTNYIRKLTGVEGKLVFTPGQEKAYPWSSESDIHLTLDHAVDGEASFIKRGYKLKNVSATKVILNPLVDPSKRVEEPIESKYLIPTYISGYETKSFKAEAVNGITIDKEVLMSNYSTDVKLSAEVELCMRTVSYGGQTNPDHVTITDLDDPTKANVESNFQTQINVVPGHKIKQIQVHRKSLDQPATFDEFISESHWKFDGNYETGGTLTIDADQILGDIEISIETETIQYGIVAHYGQDIEGEIQHPRASWTKGEPTATVKPTYDDKWELEFTKNDHFTWEGVTPTVEMNGSSLTSDQFSYSVTGNVMSITIKAKVICGDLTVNCVPNAIGYAVTTSGCEAGIEWKETPANKAYYNQEYVAYFNVKQGYSLDLNGSSIKVGNTPLTIDTDFECKWDETAQAYKLVIKQYKVTDAVTIVFKTPVIYYNVVFNPETPEHVTITDKTKKASYVDGYTNTFTCDKGYVLEENDPETISCNYSYGLVDSTTDHTHTYSFSIAANLISDTVNIHLAPKLEHYGELDTTGFTTSGVTFTAVEAQYHQALDINVTGLKASQHIDNIAIKTGTTDLIKNTDYTITYEVSGDTKTAKIAIKKDVIEGQIHIAGAAETIECNINIPAKPDEVVIRDAKGTEIKSGSKINYWDEINWSITITPAQPTTVLYLTKAKVDVYMDGAQQATDITNYEGVEFLYNRLTVPSKYVRGNVEIGINVSDTTLIYGGGACTGFASEWTPKSEIIRQFGGTAKKLEFIVNMTGIAENAFKDKAIPEIYNAEIPSACTTIGASAFQNAFTDLNKIVFNAPTNTLEIKPYAFDGLANLKIVDFSAYTDITKLTLNANSFANLPTGGQFVVKTGQKAAFQTILTNAGIDLGWTIVEQ